jgi:glycolate oxidase
VTTQSAAGYATQDPAAGVAFIEELRAALPHTRLLTESADTEAYRWDETEYMHPGMPLAIFRVAPRGEYDGATGGAASSASVPRGAGSGLSGGAIAVDGALTVVMADYRILRRCGQPVRGHAARTTPT